MRAVAPGGGKSHISSNPFRIFISSGEPSGDLHAARLAEQLTARGKDVHLRGIGGANMSAAGVELTESSEDMGAMGFAEVVTSLPRHARMLTTARREFESAPYRLAIVVDYPGFHLRLARIAAERRLPVLYYIPPQLWAWGAWRAEALRASVRHVASILPFERDFFVRHQIPTTFVGHPLLDRTPPSRSAARAQLGISDKTPVLALFPGSRPGEVQRLWPRFRAAAMRLGEALHDLRVLVASLPGMDYPGADLFELMPDSSEAAMAAADVALCKSGTTTLEAALAGTPFCLAYRVHPLTYTLARRLARCEYIGLVNLLLGRPVVPELVQETASDTNLADAVWPLFDRDGLAARAQLTAFEEIREILGPPGVAGRVADLAMEFAT
jgi:lipid-A-disaccharide synthase